MSPERRKAHPIVDGCPGDEPTVGLLLCRGKSHIEVEYALRGLTQPVGVADWEAELVGSLPEPLQANLPTVEALEAALEGTEPDPETER